MTTQNLRAAAATEAATAAAQLQAMCRPV